MGLVDSKSRTFVLFGRRQVAWLRKMLGVPLRWPRVTTRRLMVLIALAGLVLGAETTRRRGEAYAEKVLMYEAFALSSRQSAEQNENLVAYCKRMAQKEEADRASATSNGPGETRPAAELWKQWAAPYARTALWSRKMSAYYESLKRKYQHAAKYPWLPVEPDPPRPR